MSASGLLATLVGVFGVRGELKCKPVRIGSDEIRPGIALSLDAANGTQVVHIRTARTHHGRLLISLVGIDSADAAQPYVGRHLYGQRLAVVLRPGEYHDADLIGLALHDEDNVPVGVVRAVEHYPAQDMLIVDPGGVLVPLVSAFVRRIDLERREIAVTLPPGLLHDSEATRG